MYDANLGFLGWYGTVRWGYASLGYFCVCGGETLGCMDEWTKGWVNGCNPVSSFGVKLDARWSYHNKVMIPPATWELGLTRYLQTLPIYLFTHLLPSLLQPLLEGREVRGGLLLLLLLLSPPILHPVLDTIQNWACRGFPRTAI
ncbi:unnamed protein product [Tuber melanosporum]|uniref:(Perigord truffle) hypothetical protein n=1 Tax=Tuber melanosporum (strain Mel28) TaxID=656061 RepID=D5G644_TUBMM|nr:uncharacterized protein GSTUM_00001763001 [Tuber melanosporum]CAZ79987.1 unnamed protein product [Tuber melanosporum]